MLYIGVEDYKNIKLIQLERMLILYTIVRGRLTSWTFCKGILFLSPTDDLACKALYSFTSGEYTGPTSN